ncbi:PA2169 family four-helix-bundle protein [Litoribacter ruber]|uniref:PA2169 family four-helix-bundle protein n=1 Tax=Litoribacter ruber TaxID=702568 RepID=A0AAP2CGD5_9BACT|nr:MULTISPECIES: PA2169 family four-helix-bundle protein [Litoribacter]MBS9523049.1 PA2169 family four-helix-bundle protein [Litoribacter alkaliphilus]MBT0810787.1 PA2169 family four-helix-bundle protein [Litoribacter ruber]
MDNPNKNTIDKLNDLIAIAADGREGYENAAENIEDHGAKASFRQFSQERASYVNQLQQEIIGLNGKPKDSDGDVQGALHRAWLEIKSTFTGGDREAIVNGCITGEESAIESYEKALEKEYISGSTRSLLNEQLSGIKNALNVIKSYRDNP